MHIFFYSATNNREEKSVEEKFSLDGGAQGEAERFKQIVQRKAADVSCPFSVS